LGLRNPRKKERKKDVKGEKLMEDRPFAEKAGAHG